MNPKEMTHSPACTSLVSAFEGLRLEAYQDQGGVWTIGFGHTYQVKPGQTCTYEEAVKILNHDLTIAEVSVVRHVIVELTQNQFDALVSFVYNVGAGNFAHSTLLQDLNAGHYEAAAAEFLRWDKVNGIDNPGLLRRRQVERTVFEKPDA